MTICKIVSSGSLGCVLVQARTSGLVDAYISVLGVLHAFYRQCGKDFKPLGFRDARNDPKGNQYWSHEVFENGYLNRRIIMTYLGKRDTYRFSLCFKNKLNLIETTDAIDLAHFVNSYKNQPTLE